MTQPNTLIVAFSTGHADKLRQQLGDATPHISVVSAFAMLAGRRYDTILITENYQRELFFVDDELKQRHETWINDVVRLRLSGPDAKIIYL